MVPSRAHKSIGKVQNEIMMKQKTKTKRSSNNLRIIHTDSKVKLQIKAFDNQKYSR